MFKIISTSRYYRIESNASLKRVILHFVLVVSLFQAATLSAQEESKKDTTYWKTRYAFGLNINQAAISDNWTGGGVSSIAIGSNFNLKPQYRKDKISWNTEFDVIYGAIRNRGQSARKTADRILFDSKLGYDLSPKLNAFFSANFLSQVAPGFNFETVGGEEQRNLISKFFNPAFLTYGFGLEYVPVSFLKIRALPLSPRHTFVTDTTLYLNFPRNYGVPIGERVRNEWGGFQLWMDFDKNLAENLNMKTRYFLFGNYDTGALDHRIDLMLNAKITKVINVNFTAIMLYDKDQSSSIQFSQVLGIGFLLKN
jgi:hypothetical protein